MPPSLALFLWFVLLVALFVFDPAKTPRTSPALWVPLIWMFILATKLPSQWLGQAGSAAQLEEGNPLDRTIDLALILLAIGILISRSFRWADFLIRNLALTAFLSFALLSVLWSDFPFVAFKRWFRDLGNYLVILVVLSDPLPLEAIRTLLRRLFYLLISLSVLIVKYYPEIGRTYDPWTGLPQIVGPTASKNMLGVACLVGGLFLFWDTVTRWSQRKERRAKRIILVNIAFLARTLWVLNLASSATARVCLMLGCMVIVAAHSKVFHRHPGVLKILAPAAFGLYLVLAFGFGLNGELAAAVGKDPTLTDRTKIWGFILSMDVNPLFGAGYESFWMGPRLEWFWLRAGLGHINEAHNGFLEVYLNLGLIGLSFLVGFLIAAYGSICRRLSSFSSLASLSLALWTTLLFYSVTEAGFRGGLMWVTFLLGAIGLPERAQEKIGDSDNGAFDNVYLAEGYPFSLRWQNNSLAGRSGTRTLIEQETLRTKL
jgi:exopolysaccharide production protein ExoQ